MEVSHKIDFGSGLVDVPQPDNFEVASVDVIFTKDQARASFANLQLVWKGETAKKIFAVVEQGKNGGKGVSSALPYNVSACGVEFKLMLVLGHSSAKYSCDQVELPAWQAQGMDWFESQTQAYSFSHLYKNLNVGAAGRIDFSEFKKTPYTINYIPNYTNVISLAFQELVLVWQIRELVLTFTENGTEVPADTAESAVPIAGTPHIVVTIVHIVNLILRIAEIVGYLILFAKFYQELKDNFIQKKKYKLCMREVDMWNKIGAFLGVPFYSSIYAPGSKFENATWMPAKIVMPKQGQSGLVSNLIQSFYDRPEDEENNVKSTGYFDGRFDEFISTMEAKYNAEAKVVAGILVFIGVNDINSQGSYQIPNTGPVGYTFNLPQPFRTNLSELAPYYEVAFRVDQSDMNTLHRYRGTTAAVHVVSPFPITKYSGWGTSKIVDAGSALAKRKEFLTREEEFVQKVVNVFHDVVSVVIAPVNLVIDAVNAVLSVLNALITTFGGNPINTINPITNPIPNDIFQSRIGWMELSADSFSEPKTFIGIDVGGDWELHPGTETNMSAITLLNDCHSSNLATRGNQYYIYNNNRSKFCCNEFNQILYKNILTTPDGKLGKFDSIKWSMPKETAEDIQYRVKETYLTGLSEKVIIDGTP